MPLILQAVDVRGPLRWRWLLTDEATGNPLADHEVTLDPEAPQLRAFGDVYTERLRSCLDDLLRDADQAERGGGVRADATVA